tara:strand:+ start:39 stop:995 length:957 start_codon:yes stop_codon:yes gene_type:complete
MELTRRSFTKYLSAATLATLIAPLGASKKLNYIDFKASLVPGSIGLKTNASKIISQASKYNFAAITPILNELVSFSRKQIHEYLKKMSDYNLVFDTATLPIEFRLDKTTFLDGYEKLKSILPIVSKFNIPGFTTWIMPTNHIYPYMQNFDIHRARLKKVGRLLNDFNIRLGLEYVGPKTLMSRDKFPFIHTISELRTLVDSIEESSIGYLLDSFHMYCSEDTEIDYEFLKAEDIVSVQINDAVSGRLINQQMDLERNLPGATKMIDLKGFLSMLKSKSYNGCVSVEPFNKKLNNMEESAKLQMVFKSIHDTFSLIKNS